MPLKINANEYERLLQEEMNNKTSWNLTDHICVDSFINDIFEENRFLYAIVFDKDYEILKNKNQLSAQDTDRFLENISQYLEHECAVSFKSNISQIEMPEVITGIISFPNIAWSDVEDYMLKAPAGWEVFVVNPILMKYKEASIGLFLTPRYGNGHFIGECNNFIQTHTGYPLFLEYSTEEDIQKIHYNKPELTLESYVEDMKKYGKNRGLSKLLDFWADNECIKVESFESSFRDYKENLPHLIWHDINFKQIKSLTQFELIHEETGEILGPFHKFALDKSFKLADTDNGVLKLTDDQIDDLIEGKYDFRLIE